MSIISVKRLFWKKYEWWTEVSLLRILPKKVRALYVLEDLKPLFKIFYTFVCKKVPGKIADKYMENLKQASGEI